jgi:hypothetical protein
MAKSKFFEGKTGLIYAASIGLVLSDIVPTPGDALYFYKHKQWRDKWANGEFTSKQYWMRELTGYYTFNSAWWLLVGVGTYFIPGDWKTKLKFLLAVSGAGLVFTVVYKNINNDQKDMLAEQNALKQKLINKLDGQELADGIDGLKNEK